MNANQFKARYPQFASNTAIELYLAESLLFIGEAYDQFADMAQGLYVAHSCALEAEERARATSAPAAAWDGAITSKGAGRLNVSRSAEVIGMQAKDPWMRTTYGQRLCQIRDMVGKGAVAVGAKQLDDSGTGLCDADEIRIPASELGGDGSDTI